MQCLFLQIDVTEIIVHKADQPNSLVDLLDADGPPSGDGAEIDLLSTETDAATMSDDDGSAAERVGSSPET